MKKHQGEYSRSFYLLALLLIIVFLVSCRDRLNEKKIANLTYETSSFGVISEAAIIDLDEKTQKIFNNEDFRKGGEPNEITEIPEKNFKTYKIKNIEALRKEIQGTKVNEWKKEYIDKQMMDGSQWNITIKYTDQTSKSIYGSNKAPKEMKELNQLLFGINE